PRVLGRARSLRSQVLDGVSPGDVQVHPGRLRRHHQRAEEARPVPVFWRGLRADVLPRGRSFGASLMTEKTLNFQTIERLRSLERPEILDETSIDVIGELILAEIVRS